MTEKCRFEIDRNEIGDLLDINVINHCTKTNMTWKLVKVCMDKAIYYR